MALLIYVSTSYVIGFSLEYGIVKTTERVFVHYVKRKRAGKSYIKINTTLKKSNNYSLVFGPGRL